MGWGQATFRRPVAVPEGTGPPGDRRPPRASPAIAVTDHFDFSTAIAATPQKAKMILEKVLGNRSVGRRRGKPQVRSFERNRNSSAQAAGKCRSGAVGATVIQLSNTSNIY
jgi:hypothetical protein